MAVKRPPAKPPEAVGFDRCPELGRPHLLAVFVAACAPVEAAAST